MKLYEAHRTLNALRNDPDVDNPELLQQIVAVQELLRDEMQR